MSVSPDQRFLRRRELEGEKHRSFCVEHFIKPSSIIETQIAFRAHLNILRNRSVPYHKLISRWVANFRSATTPRSGARPSLSAKTPDSINQVGLYAKTPKVVSAKTCDICRHVWGFLKAPVVSVSYEKIDDLKDSIRQEIEAIFPETLREMRTKNVAVVMTTR